MSETVARAVGAVAVRAMLLDGGELALIDVREERIFSESHLLFARSVPLSRLEMRFARLVPRKGQDMLIRALPLIQRTVPDAALLIVGGGPYRGTLEKLAAGNKGVVLTGSVPWEELPAHYNAGDVFAMPCRTRGRGLDVEGLGIVYLEASATGLPVVAGRSGGAPETVLNGTTGNIVDGRDVEDVAARVTALLADPEMAAKTGRTGREWVSENWRWDQLAHRLEGLIG